MLVFPYTQQYGECTQFGSKDVPEGQEVQEEEDVAARAVENLFAGHWVHSVAFVGA